MNGILVIDKPRDFTSFDVVAVMRKICGQRKIGHSGTLDPMVTGVLPIFLGTATRAIPLLPNHDKEYIAGFKLGIRTDTQDSTGKIIQENEFDCNTDKLEKTLEIFRGDIMQIPPMYSAVKIDGQRLYDLARKGIEVERAARKVTIHKLELINFDEKKGEGEIYVSCSKGTYVRTICDDIGLQLKCGAVMTSLRRISACGFGLSQSITIEQARELADKSELEESVLNIDFAFESHIKINVTQPQAIRFSNGGALSLERIFNLRKKESDGTRVRVYTPQNEFLGLGEINNEKNELKVLRLFNGGIK